MTRLRTERLLLRKAEAADLAAIHAILSDPRATRFWSTPPHATLEQSQDWLAGMMAIDPAEGEDFVVEHQGLVIGKAGFYRYPEVGFIFHPDHWGQGFAGEALSALLDRGLASRQEAIADVDPRNDASLKLLTRLGFVETGRKEKTWLVGDEWCDSVYLRLDAEAWKARVDRHSTQIPLIPAKAGTQAESAGRLKAEPHPEKPLGSPLSRG